MGRSVRKAIGALLRTSLMSALQYRSNFIFEVLTGALRTVGACVPLWLVYTHTDAIGGWTRPQALLVMAAFLLLGAFHGGLMEPNLGEVVEAIRQGTLDLWLLKPIDAQVLVSLRKVDPAYVWDLLGAILVGAIAVWGLGTPAPLDVVVAVSMLLCGFVAMYGLWMIAICTSFYFVRVDNLRYLLMAVADAGRWPLPVFSTAIRWALTVVVPVGVLTSFPAMALRGDWGLRSVTLALSIAVGFLLASRLFWLRSLRSYTSASS
jgi:ABC-2 type transport system permease protein